MISCWKNILILGIIGGISDGVNTYAPEHSGDQTYEKGVYDYFQSIGSINEVNSEKTALFKILLMSSLRIPCNS